MFFFYFLIVIHLQRNVTPRYLIWSTVWALRLSVFICQLTAINFVLLTLISRSRLAPAVLISSAIIITFPVSVIISESSPHLKLSSGIFSFDVLDKTVWADDFQ